MNTLMIGISGVRGIVGESLTPALLVRLGTAFGTYVEGGGVVVGMDTRSSGEMVKHSVFAGLLASGCEVVDVGICPTPTLSIAVKAVKASGGIMISASHNPIEWNALKFFGADGIYLDAEEGKQLLDIYYQGDFFNAKWNQLKTVESYNGASEEHIKRVLSAIDTDVIRKRKFKVAMDCCNGAGVDITLELFSRLGCTVEQINCKPDGMFPHNPEPTFVNLRDICRLTKRTGADIGFAQDPDADRLAVIAGDGTYLGEEMTLALCADYILAKNKGPVVINLSTTKTVEDIASKHGCKTVRVPVGEVNVSGKMAELGSPVGGEGNGGVIDPRVHLGRDSLIGIGLILEMLAKTGRTIADIVNEYPAYFMVKDKIKMPRTKGVKAVKALATEYSGSNVNTADGLRISFDDSWVHIRASNTEPIVRIVAEAKTRARVNSLVEEFRLVLSRHLDRL